MNWISVKDGLPAQHDSMFAKFKDTDKWDNAMFEKVSNEVLATIAFPNGNKIVKTGHLKDGEWTFDLQLSLSQGKVTHWIPFPEPPEE